MPKPKNEKDLQRLRKREINQETNFKRKNRLLRIKEWYASGEALESKDEDWRLMMEDAYELLLQGKNRSQIAVFLKETYPHLSDPDRYEIIGNSLDLFGSLAKGGKAGMRAVITDRMLRLAGIAEEKENIDLARRILTQISNINNLSEDEEKGKVKRRVSIIRYTTDPAALTRIQEEEEYE